MYSLFIIHTTCVIFASFHQGKEEIKFAFAFSYIRHSRLEAAPAIVQFKGCGESTYEHTMRPSIPHGLHPRVGGRGAAVEDSVERVAVLVGIGAGLRRVAVGQRAYVR